MTQDRAQQNALSSRFTEKAKAVSAFVTEVAGFDEALAYCLDLCGRQGACRIKISGCDEHLSPPADGLCEMKQEKIIAAPGLDPAQYAKLQDLCAAAGFTCIKSAMRDHLSGVDIGFTVADLAIAETGTLVVNCPGEELRLATMLSEYHVCVVYRSSIVEDAFAAEQHLLKYLHKTPDYTPYMCRVGQQKISQTIDTGYERSHIGPAGYLQFPENSSFHCMKN